MGEPEVIIEKLGSLKSIQANCVAQIIIARDKLPSFIDALNRNYERSSYNLTSEKDK